MMAKVKIVILSVLFLMFAIASESAYKAKPIPCGPDAYSERQFTQAREQFRSGFCVGQYKAYGIRDPKWDDAALAFLNDYQKLVFDASDKPSLNDLLKSGKAAIDAGCTDPFVKSFYVYTLAMDGKLKEAEPLLIGVIGEMQTSKYPKVCMAKLPVELIKIKEINKTLTPEDKGKLSELAIRTTIDSLSDGSYKKGEERFQLEAIPLASDSKPDWKNYLKMLDAKPPTSPYVYKVLAARCHISIGWEYRGVGYASTVSEGGWKGLFEHLKKARELLVEAVKLNPEYPEAPTEMITIVMAEEDPIDSTRYWFDRAVAAQFDYVPAYRKYSLSIRPKWGGSIKEVYEFGLECAKTARYDTEVPWQFLNNLAYATTDLYGDRTLWKDPATTQLLNVIYDGYAKTRDMHDYFMSKKAATAWYCERYSDSRKLIDELGDKLNKDAFQEVHKVSVDNVKSQIFALGGTYGQKLQDANLLSDNGKPAQALAVYQEVAKNPDIEKESSEYIRMRMSELGFMVQFTEGKWVDIKVPKDLYGWMAIGGQWTVLEDGSVKGSSNDKRMILLCWYDLSDSFEFSADFEIIESVTDANAGVIVYPYHPRNNSYVLASAYKDKNSVMVQQYGYAMIEEYSNVGIKDRNTMLVQVREGKETVHLNGKKLGDPAYFPFGVTKDQKYQVGIGSYAMKPGTTVRFYNMKIRKIADDAIKN